MARTDNLYEVPAGLPIPEDDGACDHLIGLALPSVALASTAGGRVDLSALDGTLVVYCYPRTGNPEKPSVPGWNDIPGARGCTPQSCAFRDHHRELLDLGAVTLGLSAQSTADQKEAADRMHLPFEVLSDAGLEFARALRLPLFEVAGMTLIKRLTLIIRDGVIAQVFYPVFPPDRNPADVIAWLRGNG